MAYLALFVRAERTARRVVKDPTVAEDVAAETMTRAFVSWGRIGPHAEAWVTQVAINLALDSLRRVAPPVLNRLVESVDEGMVDRHFLVAALRRLSSRQRQVLALCFLVGLSEQEAAATLGVSPETIKTHIRRGLGVLRHRFGPDFEEAIHVAHDTP